MIKLYKRISHILTQNEKKRFVWLSLFDVLVNILDIGFLIVLLGIIAYYSHSATTIDIYLSNTFFTKYPFVPALIFFLLFSLKNTFAYQVSKMQFRFLYHIASRISRQKIYDYLRCDYMIQVETDSSVYLRSIGQQPIEFVHYVLRGVQQVISQVTMIALAVVSIMLYDTTVFSLLLSMLSIPILLTGIIMKRKLHAARRHTKLASEKSIQYLKEALAGYVESNVYGKNSFFSERYYTHQSLLNRNLADQQIIQNLPSRFIEVFAVFGFLVLIALNFYNGSGYLSLITISAFLAAAYKIIPGTVKLLNSIGQVKTYAFTLDGLSAETTVETELTQRENINSISFENVSFRYGDNTIYKDLSFEIRKGDFIGIQGASGKGKSTLINLLLGFLSHSAGDICINEKQTNDKERQRYRNRISYVKQQSFLMYDSLLRNITLQENEYDKQKLSAVLEATGIASFISQPEDIHTEITEEGKNISGGQRQRILLARALYKEFDVLILDEPFNELDKNSEHQLLAYLQSLSNEGKIIILVTHNEDSFSYCNKTLCIA